MTETLSNLVKAFIGESEARNRYSFYSSAARKEGFEQIAAIFAETAEQEKEHAKKWFEAICELKEKLGADLPAEWADVKVDGAGFFLGKTVDNLRTAIGGETYEHESMYPEFADVAEKEGLQKIADRMRAVARAEEHHHERYQKLLEQLEAGKTFAKDEEVEWMCRECGYVHVGKEAPKVCPSCDHAQAFYQLKSENY